MPKQQWGIRIGPDSKYGRQFMKCPQCSGVDCTEIEINLKAEGSVKFYSCRRCETKWWEHAGDTVALDEVLTLASQSKAR